MKRLLLTTVAALPLLAVAVAPASSQDIKQQGISKSQEAGGAQEKQAQGQKEQGKAATKNPASSAEQKTQVRAQSGPANENRSIRQGGRDPNKAAKGGNEGQNTVRQPTQGAENKTKGAQKPAQTTGQSNRNQPQNEERNQEPQPKGNVQNQQPRRSTSGQNQRPQQNSAGQRQQENANEQNQRTQQTEQGANRGQAGGARGTVTLTEDQRAKIQQTVLSGRDVPRESNVDFAINVGTVVPGHIRVVAVPETLIDIHPEWRGDEYFVVRDEIVIVDRSHRIVAMVPVGTTSSSVETRGSTASFESPEEIRQVQQVLIDKGFYHGRVDGLMGRETTQALTEFQRKEGIEASGRIDERTVGALGISSGRTEGQAGGRQGESPSQNNAGRNNAGQNNPSSTAGQGGNQPSANNPSGGQDRPGSSSTSGQGGGNQPPANNPSRGQNRPGSSSSGGQNNQPTQNQPGNENRR